MRVLITGATGFVGRALLTRMSTAAEVRGAVRRPEAGLRAIAVGDIGPHTDWSQAVAGCDVVIHAAARVHMMKEHARDPLREFRAVNTEGTLNLARQAAEAGVRRIVYISSIKVNGEASAPGRPFTADSPPSPSDPYAVSKFEAETGLMRLAEEGGPEVVVVRPPLVYGPEVKANFLTMMRWLSRGIPLPLGAVDNRRSLVALDNLVDLLARCAEHPAAAQRTFLVSDGEDLSTPELLRLLAIALHRPARLIPVPVPLLRAGGAILGRGAAVQRLLGSLQADISATRVLLGWQPPVTVSEAVQRTASWFLAQQRV